MSELQPFRGGSRERRTRVDAMNRRKRRVGNQNDHPKARHQHKILRRARWRSSTLASASASSARSRAHSFQDFLAAALALRLSVACSRVARVSPSRRRAAEAPPATGSLQLKRSEQQQNSKRAQGRCLGLYGSTGWVCEYDEPAALCFFRRTKVGRSFLPKIM